MEESKPIVTDREAWGIDWNPGPAKVGRSSLLSCPRGTIDIDPVVWAAFPALSGETNRIMTLLVVSGPLLVNLGGTAGIPSRPLDGRDVFIINGGFYVRAAAAKN